MGSEADDWLSGSGEAWPVPSDPPPPAPRWADARALTAVWRDSLPIAAAGVNPELAQDFPALRLGAPWRHDPEPNSDTDVLQAIAAKAHLALRLLPLVADAQLMSVDSVVGDALLRRDYDDEVVSYAASAELPACPLFMDVEDEDGKPVAWLRESWPLPFHLRAALCWRHDDLLAVIPFGSVDGCNLIGGTDYQPWARVLFVGRRDRDDWPDPGPGDVFVDADGQVAGWVVLDGESASSHQAAIALNLALGAMTVLMMMEHLEVPLVRRPLPRSARRRAQRAGQGIGLVLDGFPQLREAQRDPPADDRPLIDAEPCPVAATHARLNQAHGLWHEALHAYDQPDQFATKLNATLVSMRSVTFVLQKELAHSDGFEAWYGPWQERMRSDELMRWLIDARNAVEKQGDLNLRSLAVVRVDGPWSQREDARKIDVDPMLSSSQIGRHVRLTGGLSDRVRDEGVLVVERRWTLPELDGQEVLEALSHCFGVLAHVLADAHVRHACALERCEVTDDDEHQAVPMALSPRGRPPCMAASKQKRTFRRDLRSGAPIRVGVAQITAPTPESFDEANRHYGFGDLRDVPAGGDLEDHLEMLHEIGRTMLVVDGTHGTFVWLFRGTTRVGFLSLDPEDEREKTLVLARVADEVAAHDVDGVAFAMEVWEAPVLPSHDARASLHAGERIDRTESFITCLLRRDHEPVILRSAITREDDRLTLEPADRMDGDSPPFLRPIAEALRAPAPNATGTPEEES